jgi:hypothetical protein
MGGDFPPHPFHETGVTTHPILPDSERPAYADTLSRTEINCVTGVVRQKSRQPDYLTMAASVTQQHPAMYVI